MKGEMTDAGRDFVVENQWRWRAKKKRFKTSDVRHTPRVGKKDTRYSDSPLAVIYEFILEASATGECHFL